MLIPANEISPDTTIITGKFPKGNHVVDVTLQEDGFVQVVYEDNQIEWMPSNQIVMRRGGPVLKMDNVV